MRVPFNKPYMVGKELEYISQAHAKGQLSGDGEFTRLCNQWLESQIGVSKALLTHSCTAALEIAAILADVKNGDEIIMPSYTFVSTANAFVLRGAVPVFVDIRRDTLNIDERKIEQAITKNTKAIVPVHYAGVACEMDYIMDIAAAYRLTVIEDAAQGIMSSYKSKPLGSIGDFGALSFHETKNIISGEGGALLVRDKERTDRAEIIREKGTNRRAFFRGEVDKYSWVDIGSSYLPSDLIAAYLWAQMENAESITRRRLRIWDYYHSELASMEQAGLIRRPVVPSHVRHNAHMYYLLMPNERQRDNLIGRLKSKGIHSVFHYVPLHNSRMGGEHARTSGNLAVTEELSTCLVRLPLWLGVEEFQAEIVSEIKAAIKN